MNSAAMILIGTAGLLVLAAVAWANFISESWVVDALIAAALALIIAALFMMPRPEYMGNVDTTIEIPREMRD